MMHNVQTNRKRYGARRGFTLLLSVLIASILLTIGYEIYNFTTKEVALSFSGRESQFAFYAADSGVECALWADAQLDAFATSSQVAELPCGRATSTLARALTGTTYVTTFTVRTGGVPKEQCTDVRVTRSEPKQTVIESFGRNTCTVSDPLRLERAIRVTY
ncbi:hypothetical protein KGO06_01630 [Patescibacteria group bacterium]|nr:hypothetical protein [Patescibacteria group bacterium]